DRGHLLVFAIERARAPTRRRTRVSHEIPSPLLSRAPLHRLAPPKTPDVTRNLSFAGTMAPMVAKGASSPAHTQAYYDEFSEGYEKLRGNNDPGGYHELVDDLEVDFATRYAAGGDLLEVGCGTGLLLERLSKVTRTAQGIDLSPGMLERA